ncbi:ribulose-phosphate 3-epimerase [Spiroplasma tabanidicola]|uniref:Ribulose-phosphate 3-epimerase n=1 Tax=Spiroplasma tabanidicola TaxID=324079 RepID=A0A6I6CE32_9MOLU|nr:ribulose-phosphate 3-epimerase [Spiroplasma tabanidicola]QGS52234.1 ribulose-phosphate 3-epimerase [Spiroplasma tabanidicola]
MKRFIVAPSILTANFLNLGKELDNLKEAGLEWIHYDVMDYNFVPNLTFGPKILSDITSKYDFKIDIHLMVQVLNISVEEYLKPFINNKIKQLTFHFESLNKEQVVEFISFCKKNNIAASLAVNPDTSLSYLDEYLNDLDNILVMSVFPGFGGQKFIEKTYEKIKALKNLKLEKKLNFRIQVDGGVNEQTFKLVQEAGAEMIVAGSYLVGGLSVEKIKQRVWKLEN